MDLNSVYAFCKAANYNLKNRTNQGESNLDLVYGTILDLCPERLPDVFSYFFSSHLLECPGMDYSKVDTVVFQASEMITTMSRDLDYQEGMTR